MEHFPAPSTPAGGKQTGGHPHRPVGDADTRLGLTITESPVTLHGGTLDIESKVGIGTTVKVTLPNTGP